MGLLSRRSAPMPWHVDGRGVLPGGDCGGDIQAGESSGVRYIRDDMPGSLIDVIFYPVRHPDDPDAFMIYRQILWIVCADPGNPGGTEIWSAYADHSGVVPPVAFRDIREAEYDAYLRAGDALGHAEGYGNCWDGQPRWDTRAV